MPTVTGNTKTSFNGNYLGRLKFEPREIPAFDGQSVVYPGIQWVTPDMNGDFSLELVWGIYWLWMGGLHKFTVEVPDEDGEFPIENLITDVPSISVMTPKGSCYSPLDWTALRSIKSSQTNVIAFVRNPDPGQARTLLWEPESTATDDNATVAKPDDKETDEAGRWIER